MCLHIEHQLAAAAADASHENEEQTTTAKKHFILQCRRYWRVT